MVAVVFMGRQGMTLGGLIDLWALDSLLLGQMIHNTHRNSWTRFLWRCGPMVYRHRLVATPVTFLSWGHW